MRTALTLLIVAGVCGPPTLAAQGAVDPEHGLVAVEHLMRGLGSVKRVLLIGAHPDDEDTDLLAVLERGWGAQTAYLSLNRGEGGQNGIGPELGEALGLLRTEELLAARRLDGAQQFFTRAFDFGYSKSADETFRFWPHDSLLADVVDIVRRFRPQVIVSIFSGTPRDGHGQHQAAGILAREAFDVAGDPQRFPEQVRLGLGPWTPLKLYRATRFDTAAATLTVESGVLDPLYGRSYHQIAAASRSQHRSQDMGRVEALGEWRTSVALVESRVGPATARESSLFSGVDTTLAAALRPVKDRALRARLERSLRAYGEQIQRARGSLRRDGLAGVVPQLADARRRLGEAGELAAAAGPEADDLCFLLAAEGERLEAALAEAAGVIVDAFADDDLLVPGDSLQVEVQVWNGGPEPLALHDVSLRVPDGWRVEPADAPAGPVAPGTLARSRFRLVVAEGAEPTRPHYLRVPRVGAMYRWPADAEARGSAGGVPLVEARAEMAVAGQAIERRAEAVYRVADQARGEIRRPLAVVPPVSVGLAPALAIAPLGQGSALRFTVTLRAERRDGIGGRVRLETPEGWEVEPAAVDVRLAGAGATRALDFSLRPPARAVSGSGSVRALFETDEGRGRGRGRHYDVGYLLIDYPHIRRAILFEPAAARIEAFELKVDAGRRVAFVPGAGAAAAEALRAMGLQVEVLGDRAVAEGDLSRYDVIIIGARAYETNAALVASNERFLDWVKAGGTLIVEYQQYAYFNGDFAPFPLRAASPHVRVSDEEAPVTLLAPQHPLFNIPNRIAPADFDAWVQERGLYFASEWDERYEALLEMADPGEPPRRGGLLVARTGAGLYVYSGLSLFRQLSAGVPGAYRLLANLLSLGG
jgi:LmbE family N-acetylglucosaminyl deacetylase